MVRLDKIYTRSGDDGQTRLATGERVAKSSLRVAAYGSVDETNAVLGLASLKAEGDMLTALRRVQNDLFDLGADLATPTDPETYEALRITADQTKRLETEIDAMNQALEPLDSFILPGGSELAAALHMARTTARRAEREISALYQQPGEPVKEAAMQYINRLSDWLFVAARSANLNRGGDIKWVPGANR